MNMNCTSQVASWELAETEYFRRDFRFQKLNISEGISGGTLEFIFCYFLYIGAILFRYRRRISVMSGEMMKYEFANQVRTRRMLNLYQILCSCRQQYAVKIYRSFKITKLMKHYIEWALRQLLLFNNSTSMFSDDPAICLTV